jgi:DNA-binding LytR/AlgR family response regulator
MFNIVGKTQTVADTLKCFSETEPDIVFLDIEFPDGSGIDLAKKLVSIDSDIDIVFVTGHPGFALDAFEIYSYDYILKPIDESRVLRTLRQIKKEREFMIGQSLYNTESLEKPSRVAVKAEDEIVLINPREILFLERVDKKVIIHTPNHTYETTETLYNLEAKLPGPFFRSHKACLVNLNQIEKIVPWNNNTYQIIFKESKKEAYLSRRRANELLKHLPVLA